MQEPTSGRAKLWRSFWAGACGRTVRAILTADGVDVCGGFCRHQSPTVQRLDASRHVVAVGVLTWDVTCRRISRRIRALNGPISFQ